MSKKILLVDDCPLIGKIFSEFLTAQGHKVEVHNTPFGITGCIAKFSPDIILMDFNLPGMNGRTLLRIVKDIMSFRTIVVTSVNEGEIQSIIEEGLADDYFLKGWPLEKLGHKIRQAAAAA